MKTETWALKTPLYAPKERFLGIDCEQFHNWVNGKMNGAVDAVSHAYSSAKQYVSRRWYLAAVPLAFTIGMTMYGTLMAVSPDVKVDETTQSRRKKTHWDYAVKYWGMGVQKAKEVTGQDDSLENKVDSKEAKK